MLKERFIKPLSAIGKMVAYASVASSKPKVELDSHADTCIVCDNCLVLHDHNRLVNVYSYDPRDGHRSAKTVDDINPQSRQISRSVVRDPFTMLH